MPCLGTLHEVLTRHRSEASISRCATMQAPPRNKLARHAFSVTLLMVTNTSPWLIVAALTLAACSLACGEERSAGEACKASGDGFTRRDDCEHTCVDWEVTCPDDKVVVPKRCSAGTCTSGESCSKGFHCLDVGVVEKECLPVTVCAED